MNIGDLVDALLAGDLLGARQWVKDARRAGLDFSSIAPPTGLDAVRLAAAAGLVELLASRAGQPAPPWTERVGAAPREIWLDLGLLMIPALRARSRDEAPEPLRRRHVYALPDFLSIP
jgi:hypothetical protein